MNRKRKGFTLVELLVVIAIIALLMGILMPALARVRQIAFRMVCGSNLSGIGRAMLIYAHDYNNALPRAGYTGTDWQSQLPGQGWSGADRATAYGGIPGQATVSASLYLLVKFAEVTPKSYVCKSESIIKAFKASDYQAQSSIPNIEDEQAWDFGPTDSSLDYSPTNHCSYSYHMPYNRRFLSLASSEPGMAIAADRNPWLDPDTDTSNFLWNSYADAGDGLKRYQKGNAGAHQREGQNVLFMDNHVYFENQSFCGIDEDNIYTYSPDPPGAPGNGDRERGTSPAIHVYVYTPKQPQYAKDSLLLNDSGKSTKPGGLCFPADTPVWVNGALEQISRVSAGQSARLTVCLGLGQIERVDEYDGTYVCHDIVLETGNRITVVDSHRFLVDTGQWVPVQNLRSGSRLVSLNGAVGIRSVVKRQMPFVGKVYNLKVKGGDRYFVGKDGVAVRDY